MCTYKDAQATVWVGGDLSEFFNLAIRHKHGCVMSPWLFSMYYMDGNVKEMEGRLMHAGILSMIS